MTILFFPQSIIAESLSINTIVEEGKQFNGKEIEIEGEVIGEAMNRGDHTWINISDGSNAIGIWLKQEDANKIKYYGNYDYTGDCVKIVGTFYHACSEHGGETDIHGQKIQVVKRGYERIHIISEGKKKIAIGLAAIAILILFLLPRNVNRTIMKKNV